MLFNSFEFLFFFVVTTTLYFVLPHRFRWILLLASSCVFYMAFIPAYVLILVFVIFVDYFAGRAIENSEGRRRKLYLLASLIANIGTLGLFKYFNFFNANVGAVAHFLNWNYSIKSLSIILPIGLSFHTFQAMSYTIEVYRGKQKAEHHLGIYALYVMFYPQLVAGPIERPQNLIHQLHEEHPFDYERVTDGLKLMAWGLFKKVVIADNFATLVNLVYDHPNQYSGRMLLVATVLFAYQIYCDFSGYSDMAIGAAQVLGIKLMTNFNRPYFSKSISEFWRRWHISLSSWFRDYLYISLGGNRVPKWRYYFNIMVVFAVSGFWHGANWTFIIWGALHGFYMTIEQLFVSLRKKFGSLRLNWTSAFAEATKVTQVLVTFSLVCYAWIFFRAANVSDAMYVSTHLFSGFGGFFRANALRADAAQLGLSKFSAAYLVGAILAAAFMEMIHLLQRDRSVRKVLSAKPPQLRWAVYYAAVLAIFMFGQFFGNKFIYFQF